MILLYFLLVFATVLALSHCLYVLKQAHHDPLPQEPLPPRGLPRTEFSLHLISRHNLPS
ncbi:hypothetical protein Q670_06450 [Alcanivorax sp. P2S70]|jgi:hypothetical protein|uniref:hypothetical protein n=1 Tax=Alcanivorax TaxID=59753 RepID=UPI0003B430B9|nr:MULTISPECIES: hypothetical protein [Alcanivorax]ERP85321.1 hypothetical protein Q670_06450 [Alcanivorax sp. P2S70]|tara:strand:+ start:896 stop:1072 length:177 start_codon:yes stop_codon:yes gene_type:complete